MNQTETQDLTEAYRKFEAGDHADGLQQLRDLSSRLDDPWDKAALLCHEALFLVEMSQIPEARQRLEAFKKALASLGEPPPDGDQDDLPHNLQVMVRYTELRVLIEERKQPQALEVLEDLISRYPKQLSIPDFRAISEEIETHHGFLLADADRWEEARPFLEEASSRELWKGVVCYYVGHCHYVFREYMSARDRLVELLNLGIEGRWESKARY
ncbi:MAG: hypothetical protein WB559_03740, partial [Candidatus Acidiferrales bacterium]